MFKIGEGEFSCYNFPFVKEKTEVFVLLLPEFVALQENAVRNIAVSKVR